MENISKEAARKSQRLSRPAKALYPPMSNPPGGWSQGVQGYAFLGLLAAELVSLPTPASAKTSIFKASTTSGIFFSADTMNQDPQTCHAFCLIFCNKKPPKSMAPLGSFGGLGTCYIPFQCPPRGPAHPCTSHERLASKPYHLRFKRNDLTRPTARGRLPWSLNSSHRKVNQSRHQTIVNHWILWRRMKNLLSGAQGRPTSNNHTFIRKHFPIASNIVNMTSTISFSFQEQEPQHDLIFSSRGSSPARSHEGKGSGGRFKRPCS